MSEKKVFELSEADAKTIHAMLHAHMELLGREMPGLEFSLTVFDPKTGICVHDATMTIETDIEFTQVVLEGMRAKVARRSTN